ncbi:hypothetical protein A2316_01560 [Candidatus Falkowbacteria bacterium RIFOXYB2_FULL_38_15]|uniref:HEPN AbiU2-like domain-containing protein n=1 Tax=Candidatus Falkowbacteria bacterium RIFOXYA2_FULL_38_12 TaxID=1797993 RepID=A0A1F5S1D1_9BACT|nr:MAG: hypothetical protein A2257_03990 [Candidatus Falkowbacteria bacterium RIFOXYA2_FULL_38_12]OGF32924.1 MAG: hypothetical protein A2316_01560 [Candidatus Falkowbacteria bacterium RIFOXYB2_FULL_38_15]
MTLWEYYIDMSPEINYLQYNIENCEMAFDKLKEINEKLRAAMDLDSPENPLGLGHYNRIIQDYLIIKVAGLFDKDTRTISFYNLFDNASEIEKIEKEDIIRYIEEKRPRFCAHYDRDYIKSDENKFPNTQKIVNSNLKEILKRLQIILDGLKNKLQITNHKKLCQKF